MAADKIKITIIKPTIVESEDRFRGEKLTVKDSVGTFLINIGKAIKGHVDLDVATVDSVIAAMDQMDPSDKSIQTKDGKPDCAALEKILGKKVSPALRDEAVAKVNE